MNDTKKIITSLDKWLKETNPGEWGAFGFNRVLQVKRTIEDLELRFQAARNTAIKSDQVGIVDVDQEIESEYVRLKAEQLKAKK